jgi:hypothetical protein
MFITKLILQLFVYASKWLQDKQLLEAGEAKAINEILLNVQKRTKVAIANKLGVDSIADDSVSKKNNSE